MSDTLESSSSSSSSNSNTESAGKCPVDFETRSLWSLWGTKKPTTATTSSPTIPNTSTTTPASLEEAAKHAQTPHPDQRLPLSTHRLESTIPRSSHNDNSTVPVHQIRANEKKMKNNNNKNNSNNNNDNNWIYPSEQQVFNAMKRKGWKGIEEESIPSFLQIHNSVNEQSWNKIQEWEASAITTSSSPYTSSSSSTTTNIELGRFEGRPRDLTPKAWFLSTFGISNRPFDRHDWYVVNKETGIEKRYVLDFYMLDDENNHNNNNNNNHKMIPRVEIDVRPALDSPEAVWQRGTAILRDVFPGIARELQDLRKR